MCEVESLFPNVVAATRLDTRAGGPVIAWLTSIRANIEEYDPLVVVRANSPQVSESPDSAFDEILSHLGKEIYQLDLYQSNLVPEEKEVSLSILNIFDECLDQMTEKMIATWDPFGVANKVQENGWVANFSDEEDMHKLEDKSVCEYKNGFDSDFVTSTPGVKSGFARTVCDKRTRLSNSTSSSLYDGLNLDDGSPEWTKLIESDSEDSESTCWSYKECSDGEADVNNPYASVWIHSSGFHNSDEILRRVLSKNCATVSRLSFDTATDFTPAEYNVYALQEVGDRCGPTVADMTPDRPYEDGYEPVKDAITDENIYEEIEYNYSYTDEGCSCGTSVEVESISASSEGVDRESPLYQNLRDNDAYAITPDVLYWKSLLQDPFYCDDEEDEWITPEECAVYSREQRPPLVIPRITNYRAPRQRPPLQMYPDDSVSSMRRYPLGNWSPTKDRPRVDIERSFSKDDSPRLGLASKRLGGSTENLLHVNPRRPHHLQIPASSSGDSLDVEIRGDHQPSHIRNRKVRSMVHRKSPVPAPRLMHPLVEGLQGPVKRTKFFEGGKKSKKNWTEAYMILTGTALYFYKDYKTYSKKTGPPGTPPSPTASQPELTLTLKDARVELCTPMQTRRHSRSLVLTCDNDQFLIQDETEEGARKWYSHIRTQIAKLSSYPPMPAESPHYLSSSTDVESLGRTPPASRHQNRNKREIFAAAQFMNIAGSNMKDRSDKKSPTEKKSDKNKKSNFDRKYGSADKLNLDKKHSPTEKSRSKLRSLFGSQHNLHHKPGGSSNEDLSDSTEVSKSHVRSRLRKFFAKRPAIEVLMKKGIYEDEPVFGKALDKVCSKTSPFVPDFVVACVTEIEREEENMCTDGLYRASGNLSQVQKLRLEIDQNNMSVIQNNTDIHVLTGSLKLFFRELKEPLIPCSFFDRILAACSIRPKEAKIKEFRDIVNALPQCNRDTLKYLLEHLIRVTTYSERNRMHTANVAIVFGPTLLWAPAEQAHNIAVDCIQQNNVVDTLLTEFKDIFADDTKGKKKS